jgi:hypothetical protein
MRPRGDNQGTIQVSLGRHTLATEDRCAYLALRPAEAAREPIRLGEPPKKPRPVM